MLYALVGEDDRLAALSELDSPDNWMYPDDLALVSAEGFVPDPRYDLSDYVYVDGAFLLDEDGIADRELNRPYNPFEVLTTIFQQTDVMDDFSDDVLAHMAPYMAGWAADISYNVGDKVQYGDKPYRCLQAHTSIESWNPEDAPSLWARILGGQDGQIAEWEQPDSTNPYMTGDRVSHNGHIWESTVDNNVWEPGVYGWNIIE